MKRATDVERSLCRPLHGLVIIADNNPGFRFAPPWALCFRLLCRLVESFPSTTFPLDYTVDPNNLTSG